MEDDCDPGIGKSLRVCGWTEMLISVDNIAQHGCIWKLHTVHLNTLPLVVLAQISHLDFNIPPLAGFAENMIL